MLGFVTGADVAAEVTLMRAAFNGTILLVEGDTDSKFFRRFVDQESCSVVSARSKNNAIYAIERIDADRKPGIVCILDADFLHMTSHAKPKSSNMVFLEVHDLEILLLSSPALEHVLAEYASGPKLQRYGGSSSAVSVLSLILQAALPFGVLRYISERRELNLSFEGIKYEKIVNRDTLAIDLQRLVLVVLSRSNRSTAEATQLRAELEETIAEVGSDPLQVCCGHDASAVLCIALRKLLGNRSKGIPNQEIIEAALRLAFNFDDLRNTKTYRAVREWEQRNPPFQVFR